MREREEMAMDVDVRITANAACILQIDNWRPDDGSISYRAPILRVFDERAPVQGRPIVVTLSRDQASELLRDMAWWLETYREQARGIGGCEDSREDARRLAPFVRHLRAALTAKRD